MFRHAFDSDSRERVVRDKASIFNRRSNGIFTPKGLVLVGRHHRGSFSTERTVSVESTDGRLYFDAEAFS